MVKLLRKVFLTQRNPETMGILGTLRNRPFAVALSRWLNPTTHSSKVATPKEELRKLLMSDPLYRLKMRLEENE